MVIQSAIPLGPTALLSASSLSVSAGSKKYIYLNWNENPYPPFPEVLEAMRMALPHVGRYPQNMDTINALVKQLAPHLGAREDQIIVGSGLNSLLHLVADTFALPGKNFVVPRPTFEYLEWYAKEKGKSTQVFLVDLKKDDLAHNLDAMFEKVNDQTTLVYICNPNNPTGTITPRTEIEAFIKKLPPHVYVLIDEAYHAFARGSSEYVSFIEKPIDHPRVIVGQTFSKSHSLAGQRIGYLVSSKETIDLIKSSRLDTTNTLDAVTLAAASAGLKRSESLRERISIVHRDIQEFHHQAARRGLRTVPTYTNFVLLETNGRPVSGVIQHFKEHDILIGREFVSLPNYVRISLGLPSEMETFWKAWDALPPSPLLAKL